MASNPDDLSAITSHGTDSDLQGVFRRRDSRSSHCSLRFQVYSWIRLTPDFQVLCVKTSSRTAGAMPTASNQTQTALNWADKGWIGQQEGSSKTCAPGQGKHFTSK